MKIKISILLAILVAGYFYISQEEEAPLVVEKSDDRIFAHLNHDEIFYLGVSHKEGVYEIQNFKNGWMLLDPKNTPADTEKVNELLGRVKNLRPKRVLEKEEDETFGFDDPEMLLAVEDKNKKLELVFAAKNPLSNNRYAKLTGSEKVYLIDNFNFETFKINKKDIWDAKPLFFKLEDLLELEVKEASKGNFSIVKEGDNYRIKNEKTNFIADPKEVLKALNSIANLKISKSPRSEITNLLAGSLSSPKLILTLKFKDNKENTVLFGEETSGNEKSYYFKIKENPLIYRFSGRFLPEFFKGASNFKSKKIFANVDIKSANLDYKEVLTSNESKQLIKEIEVLSFVETGKDFKIDTPALVLEVKDQKDTITSLVVGKSIGSLQAGEANIDAPRFAIVKKDGDKETVVISAKTLVDLKSLQKDKQ